MMAFCDGKKVIEDTLTAYMAGCTAVTYRPDYDPHSTPGEAANEWAHIRALTYDGVSIDGHKTAIFAYIGFPKGADAAHPVPAMVLVHGGGGHAFAEWVKIWNDRGYAAIAMDNTGFFPSAEGRGVAGREEDDKSWWQHGLPPELYGADYADIPDNDGMAHADGAIDRQWMLHAVAATIGAHNILLSDARVDAARVGITGVSWGGVITSIALGYDTRYAFAIPIYGSGHLDEALTWMGPMFGPEPARTLWSAAERFDRITVPVLWMCYSADTAFSVNSNSRSYDDTLAAGAILSMKIPWGHSHLRGWTPVESYLFADAAVKGAPAMTRILREPEGRQCDVIIRPDCTATAVTARMLYITEPLSYSVKEGEAIATLDPVWKTAECTVDGDTVRGTVPPDAVGYYAEITTDTPRGVYGITTRFTDCDCREVEA